jgi:hypothetical protein
MVKAVVGSDKRYLHLAFVQICIYHIQKVLGIRFKVFVLVYCGVPVYNIVRHVVAFRTTNDAR